MCILQLEPNCVIWRPSFELRMQIELVGGRPSSDASKAVGT